LGEVYRVPLETRGDEEGPRVGYHIDVKAFATICPSPARDWRR